MFENYGFQGLEILVYSNGAGRSFVMEPSLQAEVGYDRLRDFLDDAGSELLN